mgnify:CR=1 FL=1
MAFTQSPPQLTNPYLGDRVLQSALRRMLPHALFEHFHAEANELGQVVADELYPRQLRERLLEPRHTPFDPWGRRIDEIALTPLWQDMPALTARFGLVWHGYDASKAYPIIYALDGDINYTTMAAQMDAQSVEAPWYSDLGKIASAVGSAALLAPAAGAAGTAGVTGANGAFLGEGMASGVGAWDAALGATPMAGAASVPWWQRAAAVAPRIRFSS